jgi:hypothetical protein
MRFAKSLVGHNSRTEFIKAFKVLLSILEAAAKISGLGFVGVFASAAEGAVNRNLCVVAHSNGRMVLGDLANPHHPQSVSKSVSQYTIGSTPTELRISSLAPTFIRASYVL